MQKQAHRLHPKASTALGPSKGTQKKNAMKRYFLPIACLTIASLWSCGDDLTDKTEVLRHIPAEASLALTVDVPALMEKVDFEWLRQTAFFRDFLRKMDDHPQLKALLADPAGAGIDVDKRSALFVQVLPEDPEIWFAALVIPLAQPDAFARLSSALLTTSEQDGYVLGLPEHALFDTNQPFVAWNEHVAWIGLYDEGGWPSTLEETLAALAALEKDQSLASVATARKVLRGGHDFDLWATLDFAGKNPAVRAGAAMTGIDPKALEGNVVTGWYQFLAGRAEGQMSFHLQEALSDELIARLFKDKPEFDIARHLPKGEIEFGLSLAFDLIGADKWLTEHPATRRFVKFLLTAFDLSIEEVQQIFGGEVLVAKYRRPDDGLLIGIHIEDEVRLRTLIRALERGGAIQPLDEQSWTMNAMARNGSFFFDKPFEQMHLEDDILWFSPNGALAEAVAAGRHAKLPGAFRDVLRRYPFGLAADLDALAWQGRVTPLEMYTLHAANGTIHSRLTFTDDSKNSLRLLAEWMEATYSSRHEADDDHDTPL